MLIFGLFDELLTIRNQFLDYCAKFLCFSYCLCLLWGWPHFCLLLLPKCQSIMFGKFYIGILKLHVGELISCLFLFLTGKWWLVFFSQPPCTLAFFHILVVQCQYVVVTTFVHTILLCHIDMAHVIDLIYCPLLISFLPPLWLLLSENSLFDLMKLIMSGDIDSTFKRLEEWYPQVIKVFPLFFLVLI